MIRSSGWFDIKDLRGRRVARRISPKRCRPVQRPCGYSYGYGKEEAAPSSPRLRPAASSAAEGR